MRSEIKTFEDFQATRSFSLDIIQVIKDERYAEKQCRGWIYLNCLVIEEVDGTWPEVCQTQGKWYLQLENTEEISPDLEKLEKTLYEWAKDGGYFDA